ncbi:MAG: hypothetical protein ACOZCP_02520 [Pseudomonadota bacterium]
MQQLDIFADSRDTWLANAVIDALIARDAARAGAAIEELRKEAPAHAHLSAFSLLCDFLRALEWDGLPVVEALERAEAELVPACAALGSRAEEFLHPFWRRLAQRATAPYDPVRPEAHAAALWLRAGEYARAEAAAREIPDGENRPEVLRWCCLATHRLGGLDAALPFVIRMAWIAPERLGALVGELGEPLLARAWRDFGVALGDLDASWFPAWFLHEHPASALPADALPENVPAAAAACTVLARLLQLEKRGHSPALVSLRGRLKGLGEGFYEFYMERRRVGR